MSEYSVNVYLCGPAGSGKSEVAKILEDTYGYRRISLGDYCRKVAAVLDLKPTRQNLQRIGDGIRTGMADSAALAKIAKDKVLEHAGVFQDRWVIDGVRLVAEAKELKGLFSFGVSVEASPEVRAQRLQARDGTTEVPQHHTEWESTKIPVDWHVQNDGNQESLRAEVAKLHQHLLKVENEKRIADAERERLELEQEEEDELQFGL